MLDYKIHAENDSMYNTPPCWAIYMCGLVFEKLLKQGKEHMESHCPQLPRLCILLDHSINLMVTIFRY